MMVRWQGEELRQPISADVPCGGNLEDTQLLASFDAFRLFGRTKPFEPSADDAAGAPKTVEDRDERVPEWPEIKEKSLEALRQSKDLRLLVHLAAALLRTDGLLAFAQTVQIASEWLETHWEQIFPPVDGDAVLRRSALNCFADPIAVIDGVRRAPLVSSRQHGTFSLRDIEMATGLATAGKGDQPPDNARVTAAFAELPLEDLSGLQDGVGGAARSLKAIDAKMRAEVGTEAAPTFELLSAQLGRIDRILRAQLAARPDRAGIDVGDEASSANPPGAPQFTGAVKSRDDAIRALDAVADYFRRTEPSSPVPMFCERAKRLVAKEFLDVLADIVPEAVGHARAAAGMKD
jgi:type VI secretion system protein ImpA